ncbi:hypothetical protein ACRRTK_002110 [Alexandromys fortis]
MILSTISQRKSDTEYQYYQYQYQCSDTELYIKQTEVNNKQSKIHRHHHLTSQQWLRSLKLNSSMSVGCFLLLPFQVASIAPTTLYPVCTAHFSLREDENNDPDPAEESQNRKKVGQRIRHNLKMSDEDIKKTIWKYSILCGYRNDGERRTGFRLHRDFTAIATTCLTGCVLTRHHRSPAGHTEGKRKGNDSPAIETLATRKREKYSKNGDLYASINVGEDPGFPEDHGGVCGNVLTKMNIAVTVINEQFHPIISYAYMTSSREFKVWDTLHRNILKKKSQRLKVLCWRCRGSNPGPHICENMCSTSELCLHTWWDPQDPTPDSDTGNKETVKSASKWDSLSHKVLPPECRQAPSCLVLLGTRFSPVWYKMSVKRVDKLDMSEIEIVDRSKLKKITTAERHMFPSTEITDGSCQLQWEGESDIYQNLTASPSPCRDFYAGEANGIQPADW